MQIGLIGRLIPHDEIDHRFGILQTVRMMVHARLQNHLNRTTQCQITGTDDIHVLPIGYHLVTISTNGQDGNTRLGQRLQMVDRIPVERSHLLICQLPLLQQIVPQRLILPSRPAKDVTDRCIQVDTGHLLRMLDGPVQGIQATATEAFQCNLLGKSQTIAHQLIKFRPL